MANYRKLGRVTSHRNLMLRNLVTDLLRNGRIETTVTRAKETRRMAEKMITLAKRGDLHARRQVLAYVLEEDVVKTLFYEIAPKYAERNGGYTRMIKKSSLYTNPLVLKNFFTGRPLRGIHAFNSSTVGFSSTIKRLVNSMLFSVNHFLAFWHVLHAGYCKNNVAIFIYNLILDI